MAKPVPHNLEAERAVLGAVLLDPEVLEDLRLTSADFYLPGHQALFSAFCELAADREPIDLRTTQARLDQRGELELVGGLAYLAALDLDLPDIRRISTYAAIIRERALRRQLLEMAGRLERRAQTGKAEASAIAALAARELEELQEHPAGEEGEGRAVRLLREVVDDARNRWEVRLATGQAVLGLRTGIPRLDKLLCGFQRGLYLLAGPPGVGKTLLAVQMAVQVAHEAPVIYATFENSAASLLLRILCTQAGVNPLDASRGFADPQALGQAAAHLEPLLANVDLVDGDGRLSVAQLRARARRLMAARGAQQCLVVVDYLQLWAKTSRELRDLSDTRARVDTLAGELVALSKQLNGPVLALSSQSRAAGGYGRGGGEANLDSLKESGDLEYSADVALFLTEARERSATPPSIALDLAVKKNRNGPTGTVSLIGHRERGLLREEAGG